MDRPLLTIQAFPTLGGRGHSSHWRGGQNRWILAFCLQCWVDCCPSVLADPPPRGGRAKNNQPRRKHQSPPPLLHDGTLVGHMVRNGMVWAPAGWGAGARGKRAALLRAVRRPVVRLAATVGRPPIAEQRRARRKHIPHLDTHRHTHSLSLSRMHARTHTHAHLCGLKIPIFDKEIFPRWGSLETDSNPGENACIGTPETYFSPSLEKKKAECTQMSIEWSKKTF